MEIAGGGSEHILPRSGPFPYPPHKLARSDQACIDANPEIWVPAPTARSNGGSRALCCANGICQTCPIDSKFTIVNGIDHFKRPNVSLLAGTEVRRVERDGGAVTGVTVRDRSGAEVTIPARLAALATNAIFNSAILLRSGVESEVLGRFLHEQCSRGYTVNVAHKGFFGGTSITALCYGAYDGAHRAEAAAVLIENYNSPSSIRLDPGRWTDRMSLNLIAEDLPQPENRVSLDADGEPRLTWIGHHPYGNAGLDRAGKMIPDLLPFAVESLWHGPPRPTESHIQGTHRIGRDAALAVVDERCRVFGTEGLYALGAGVFPSCSPANPSLTLSAISLMAGRSLA